MNNSIKARLATLQAITAQKTGGVVIITHCAAGWTNGQTAFPTQEQALGFVHQHTRPSTPVIIIDI